MYLPSRVIGTAIVLRSVLLWLGIRAVSLGLGSPWTAGAHSVLVLALVVGLARHDQIILKEHVLLGNMGVSWETRLAYALGPALVAELTLHVFTV